MANDPFFRPTLLVGVGGTGCRIAESIFREARHTNREMRNRIGVLVFDTDANDLARMPSIPNSSRVQFSTADPVYKIVRNNPDITDEWFPDLDTLPHEIKNMVLVEGAGQVRMLTRLALHDAFRTGEALRRATSAIGAIATNDGSTRWDGAVNILLVGSLAGATGSGSFYQIALMLRDACRRSQVTPNIMGLFLMPDVYVRTGALPAEQIANVQANAYASIKELNALNVLATLPERGADFTYSFMPGRTLDDGETPFSSVTFIDFENSRGGNMGRSIHNYQEMAKRAGYMLIFSPLGAKYGSMTVNDIRAKMLATFDLDSNIYSSIGISALNYPHEAMRDYLVDRLVMDNIDESWVRLDDLFRQRARSYAEKKAQGKATGEEPSIDQTYLRDLELLAEEEKVPFFRDIWEELHPEVVDEDTGRREQKALFNIYLDALLDYSKGSFWRSGDMSGIAEQQAIDSSIFEVKSRISDSVQDSEAALDEDFRVLTNALRSEPETIFNTSWTTADTAKESDWRMSNIQSFVIRNGPHPVRTRAFLYQLQHEIARRREMLDPEGVRQRLYGLATVFNSERDKNAPTRGDTAIFEQADAASGRNQSLLSRLTGTSTREFVKNYIAYYNSSRMFMRRYAEERLQDAILEMLEKEIQQLILAYTGLFSEIEGISRELGQRIERAEARYDGRGTASDGNVWVYSDAKSCRAAWKRVQDGAAMVPMDKQIHHELSEALFGLYRESQKNDRGLSFNALGTLFRDSVVEGFGRRTITESFGREWNISVIEALRREAALDERTDWEDFLRSRVELVASQSEPFSTLADPSAAGQGMKYWAMHPSIRDQVGSSALFEELFTFAQGDNPLEEDEFHQHAVYCCNFRLNLRLEDFGKLSSGDPRDRNVNAVKAGAYQQAYGQMIDGLIEAELSESGRRGRFTPHVHRDWHRPGVLPELSLELDERIRSDAARAVVVSQMLGLLERTMDYGREVVTFTTLNRDVHFSPAVTRQIAKSSDFDEVALEIMRSADVIQVALDYWSEALRQAGEIDMGEDAALWQAMTNVELMVPIARIAVDRRNGKKNDALVTRLAEQWCLLAREMVPTIHQDLEGDGEADALHRVTGEMRQALMERLQDEKGMRPETLRAVERSFDKARDSILSKV